jgi:hypothetical protein
MSTQIYAIRESGWGGKKLLGFYLFRFQAEEAMPKVNRDCDAIYDIATVNGAKVDGQWFILGDPIPVIGDAP